MPITYTWTTVSTTSSNAQCSNCFKEECICIYCDECGKLEEDCMCCSVCHYFHCQCCDNCNCNECICCYICGDYNNCNCCTVCEYFEEDCECEKEIKRYVLEHQCNLILCDVCLNNLDNILNF